MKSSIYKITKSLGLEKSDVDKVMSNSARDNNAKHVAASVDLYKAGTEYGTVSPKDVYKAGTYYGTVSSRDLYKAGTYYGTISVKDF